MLLKRGQLLLLIANIILIIVFLFLAVARKNYEFIIYWGVIVFFFILILITLKKTRFPNTILWGLTIWALLHLIGGLAEYADGIVFYKLVIIEIFRNSNFVILKYDQFVHAFGFGITTLIAHHLIKPYLGKKVRWSVYSVLLVLMGMGAGVLNEIIEFLAVLAVPETGVGGYYNTMWDIVFNTIGAIIAVVWINLKRLRQEI